MLKKTKCIFILVCILSAFVLSDAKAQVKLNVQASDQIQKADVGTKPEIKDQKADVITKPEIKDQKADVITKPEIKDQKADVITKAKDRKADVSRKAAVKDRKADVITKAKANDLTTTNAPLDEQDDSKSRAYLYLPNLASGLKNLSNRYLELGRHNEAVSAAEQCVAIYRELANEFPNLYLSELADSLNNLGNILSKVGLPDQGLAATQESVEIYTKLNPNFPIFQAEETKGLTQEPSQKITPVMPPVTSVTPPVTPDKIQAVLENAKPSDKVKQVESWISNGKELGRWWLGSSKHYETLPTSLLYHVEGEYSFNRLRGGEDVQKHKGAINIVLRKTVFTSMTSYEIKDKVTKLTLYGFGPKPITMVDPSRKQKFQEMLFFDVNKQMSLIAGFQWYRDNKRFIEDRYFYHAGLMFNLLDLPTLKIQTGATYGYGEIFFKNENIVAKKVAAIPRYDSDVVFFIQNIKASLTDRISLFEQYVSGTYLKDQDYCKWKFDADVTFKLTDNISLFTKYEAEYDSNMVDEKIPGTEKKDIEYTTGIKLMF